MNSSKRIIIIGAGIGGLATAALLAQRGYTVTIIEKNKTVGGRARRYIDGPYTFDMGPSWYMMPKVFFDFFAQLGRKIEDYYSLVKLPVHYKVFYDNGNTYTITNNKKEVASQFEKAEKGAGKQLETYLEKSKKLYTYAMDKLVRFDYSSLRPLMSKDVIAHLPISDLLNTFHADVAKRFKNPELQKIIEFTTVFLGGSPYNTPAFYELISHTDFNQGIWYPQGGIYVFIQALEKICGELGVKIVTDSEVKKIDVDRKSARSVITNKGVHEADIVVCNADYAFAETTFLDPEWQTYSELYWNKKTLSPSGFIIYLGLDKQYKKLEHHNLYFNSSWEKGFDSVYKKSQWPSHPSYYVHVPSRTDQTVAPTGHDTLMILVPVAAGLHDSQEIRTSFAHTVITHLEKLIQEPIYPHIKMQRVYAQNDFVADYHAYKGSAFGIAHTLFQTALFRPKNFSKKVKNLFYVGQYTNPGVGMPICLISAQIVAKHISTNDSR